MKYLSVIITVFFIAFIFFLQGFLYLWIFQTLNLPFFFKLLIFILLSGLIIALIYVAIERIKEIKKEKKNDLSQY
jgi:membrane protein implicated in regulation of membrane protease activity